MERLTVDARHLACPMPIVRLAQALANTKPGALVALLATDPATEDELRAFAEATGHELLSVNRDGDGLFATVRKAER